MTDLEAPEAGYLLIADITGYTRFLKDSELAHARGILEALFSSLLENLRSPFSLSNIQGDAILAHARAKHVADGGQVLDLVEALYCGFADALDHMLHNTTCTCSACRNIANLDLKLLVHYGSYIEQAIADRTELGGPEVILIHRLLKNHIIESTGIHAYAAFTEAATSAAGLAPYFESAPLHLERTEEFGEVPLRVLDMRPSWETHRAQQQIAVGDDDPRWFPDVTVELPVPPDRAWHYLTDPGLRSAWGDDVTGMTRTNTDRGRAVIGSVDHCAHGNGAVMQLTIVDWRPNDHVTFHVSLPSRGTLPLTLFVSPTPTGSRVEVRAGKPVAPNKLQQFIVRHKVRGISGWAHDFWIKSLANMTGLAEREAQAGLAPIVAPAATPETVKAAVDSRLAAT